MDKMNVGRGTLAGMLIIGLSCGLSIALAQGETKISSRNLPPAVLAAFHKAYPNATIKGASSEVEKGKRMYEVESVDGKIGRDLLYAEDGTCVEIEETISPKAIPDEVTKSLQKEFPKGKVQKAEKLTKDGTIQYECIVLARKEKREVVVDLSGKIVKNEKVTMREKED